MTADQVLTVVMVELGNFEERGVYDVVEREVMEHQSGSSPKKAHRKPQYLREFVSNAFDRDTLLSGTASLSVGRSLITEAATCRSSRRKIRAMLLDVTAASLHGDCERPLFMELHQEDPRSSNPNLVARLIKSSYGTRDATQLWARHVGKTLRSVDCTETKGALGVYYHKEEDVEITCTYTTSE